MGCIPYRDGRCGHGSRVWPAGSQPVGIRPMAWNAAGHGMVKACSRITPKFHAYACHHCPALCATHVTSEGTATRCEGAVADSS